MKQFVFSFPLLSLKQNCSFVCGLSSYKRKSGNNITAKRTKRESSGLECKTYLKGVVISFFILSNYAWVGTSILNIRKGRARRNQRKNFKIETLSIKI
jgi:hypothetical protein